MSGPMDPELEDALRDPELLRLANLLASASTPEPPLDDAFRSGLRRQLMEIAWEATERRNPWWRRLASPRGMAWAGAAAVVVVVASVVLYTTSLPPGVISQVVVGSPLQDSSAVALRQPILVSFNQPMNHATTEAAVQITPATSVTFSWSGDTTLYIQPASGDLAPNTQYQVTIGPSATTQTDTPISTPKSFTFVTQPIVTPPAPASPTPANNSLLTGLTQLASNLPTDGTAIPVMWSADSSTVYFVAAGGALDAVAAKGGDIKTLVPDGVSVVAINRAGERIAYVRAGKLEILTLATNTTTELAVTAAPTAVTWVRLPASDTSALAIERLYWGSADGVFTQLAGGSVKRVAGRDQATGQALSIAPNGAHAVFQSGTRLVLLDLGQGTNVPLGTAGAGQFQGWSPDSTRVVFGGVVADMKGGTVSSLPTGDVSWSAGNVILVGTDTGLVSVRPDGTGQTKLADGTFRLPAWAPDSSTFSFVRGTALWAASAPPQAAKPSAADQASAVATQFMHARLVGNRDLASSYLDDAGKAAYGAGNPALIPHGDLVFKRFYVLTAELDPSAPSTVRFVVRLVFASDKLERTAVEETLTLRRAEDTDPFLIDGVSAGAQRDLGRGPEVVAVTITADQAQVTFDSDLQPSTIAGVSVQDGQGNPVSATVSYSDRTVTLSAMQLVAGGHYRLVVMKSVQDVNSRHPASEYDLELIAPAPDAASGGVTPTPPTPSPSPTPIASPSPTPS